MNSFIYCTPYDGAAIFICEIKSLAIVMCIACARNFIVIFVDER
jgi:hypothetical protein